MDDVDNRAEPTPTGERKDIRISSHRSTVV